MQLIIRWDGSEANSILQSSPPLHSAIPEPPVFSSMRESGRLYLEKCAQKLKESSAIFTLLGRLTLREMSVFDDALGLYFSFCQSFTTWIERYGRFAHDCAHQGF